MTNTKFVSVPLFGGAIVADLPEKFVDVSNIRQVPDNQEVYIDKDGYSSIIFDICQRVGPSSSSVEIDGRALSTHLEDLVADESDSVRVWNTTVTEFTQLPQGIPAYTTLATQTPHSDPAAAAASANQNASDFTAIILTLVRLEKEATDILITINVPHIKGEYDEEEIDLELGKQGRLIGDAVEFASRIWSTFQIKNWQLFNAV